MVVARRALNLQSSYLCMSTCMCAGERHGRHEHIEKNDSGGGRLEAGGDQQGAESRTAGRLLSLPPAACRNFGWPPLSRSNRLSLGVADGDLANEGGRGRCVPCRSQATAAEAALLQIIDGHVVDVARRRSIARREPTRQLLICLHDFRPPSCARLLKRPQHP